MKKAIVDDAQAAFARAAIEMRFQELVREYLGENRAHPSLSDADAHSMIMAVICTGISHREAAAGHCTEDELLQRHHDYAQSGLLGEFLYDWPRLQLSVMRTPPKER